MTLYKFLFLLNLVAFTLNLPFGYLRSKSEKYSLKWFAYLHLPIPVLILLRFYWGISIKFAPLLLVSSVLGQVSGAKANKVKNKKL